RGGGGPGRFGDRAPIARGAHSRDRRRAGRALAHRRDRRLPLDQPVSVPAMNGSVSAYFGTISSSARSTRALVLSSESGVSEIESIPRSTRNAANSGKSRGAGPQ